MAQAKDTKTLLLKTAMDLIWKHSYASISVDEICKAAGAQKGSFYHFFSSKQDLAREAMQRMWQELQPQLDHIFSSQSSGLERLRAYAKFSLETQQNEIEQFGMVVGCPFTTLGSERSSEPDGLTATAWELLQKFRRYIVLALRDAKEIGEIEVDDAETAANELFFHYLGCNSAARLSGSTEPLKDIYQRWLKMLNVTGKPRVKKKLKAA